MGLWKSIVEVYPDLTDADFNAGGIIELRDDGDGIAYIAKWEYDQPIPDGLTVGKPTA